MTSQITWIMIGFIKELCNLQSHGLRGESPSLPSDHQLYWRGLAFLEKILIRGKRGRGGGGGSPKSEFQSMLSDQ